jgi:hypothetical protein
MNRMRCQSLAFGFWPHPTAGAAHAFTDIRRKALKLIGIVLIVFGIVALALGGFSYTDREKVLDLGPLEATTETRETVPLPPIVGLGSIAGGIALVAIGARSRSRA